MTRFRAAMACVAALASGCNEPPESKDNSNWAPVGSWVEVWRDDFDGPADAAPIATNWNVASILNPQNGELEAYTNRRDNTFLDGSGNLVVRAISESYMGKAYTSGRLDTRTLHQDTYGRFEARIQVPAGRGLWPAFWLLGTGGAWPATGEIDVMEIAGSQPATVRGSLHGPNYSGGGALVNQRTLASGSFADGYHVFAVEWTQDGIRWLVDEQPYHVRLRSDIEAIGRTWVFDHPFYVIMNLAVGGVFDGPPSSATVFPCEMRIDYVKVSRLEP